MIDDDSAQGEQQKEEDVRRARSIRPQLSSFHEDTRDQWVRWVFCAAKQQRHQAAISCGGVEFLLNIVRICGEPSERNIRYSRLSHVLVTI
ncbi:unnamed protein product [Heligmosomoides polygyrus]|uniref:Uncharacterized protein n=1 Tax=Heligmosomoides polygyrus TaxID=6339 RepID=A0A183FWH4_HELPZ|nr:unnamed protein product [Heligmosomoides polygyrus]